ncbi:uncharacterized [Tachysurus ichikawai]
MKPRLFGAESHVHVPALYSRIARHVELNESERGGICRCFYGGAGLHPGGICFAPHTLPARGACSRGNGFKFQASLQVRGATG